MTPGDYRGGYRKKIKNKEYRRNRLLVTVELMIKSKIRKIIILEMSKVWETKTSVVPAVICVLEIILIYQKKLSNFYQTVLYKLTKKI